MARVFLTLLGCDKNRIDAEIMAKKLQDAGHLLSPEPGDCDVALINTCGFIEAAKRESIDVIFDMVRLKESGGSDIKAVVVTGCLAERYRGELARSIPEADAVVGLGKNGDIVDIVERALAGVRTLSFDAPEKLPVEGARLLSTPAHYAYLKIAEGCSNRCAYCAIPDIRGRYRSRAPLDVLAEAKWLAGTGVRELILVAQDTTAYGRDLKEQTSLASLLRELTKIDGFWKIRVLYAYPEHITDELMEVMSREERIARYIDVPFQHADGEVLARMGRAGDKAAYLALVGRLRRRIPGIAIRSSFIIGFPGETEDSFWELMDFRRSAEIDRAGCFTYSAEEGTPAFELADRVPKKTADARHELFMSGQTRMLADKQAARVGETLEVIVDAYDPERGMYAARTEFDAPEIDTVLYIDAAEKVRSGAVIRVKVTTSDCYDLYGAAID